MDAELGKSVIRCAVARAYRDQSSTVHVNITTTRGNRSVLSREKFAAGALILVPLTPNVVLSAKAPASGVLVEYDSAADSSQHFWLTPKVDMAWAADDANPGFKVPFWSAKSAQDSELANMEPSAVFVSIGSHLGQSTESVFVKVPVLVNFKPLEKGDELCVKPACAKGSKRQGDAASASSKKQKLV
eukprot:9170207-Pyramimonas_sp.AAC.1